LICYVWAIWECWVRERGEGRERERERIREQEKEGKIGRG
jgi:hypothetical protein